MPRKEDIERFTQVLNSLGDEPAIRASRAQTIEAVPPPGEDEPGGAEDGLDTLPAGDQDTDGTEALDGLQDFFSGISELPADAPSFDDLPEPADADPAAGSSAAGSTDEEMDFSSLFGDEAETQPIEDIEKPKPGRARATPKPAPEPEPAVDDAFPSLEGELPDLQDDMAAMETLPEVLGEPPAEDQGELAGGSFEEPVGEMPEAAPEDTGSFDLPDLGGMGFADTEAPSEAAADQGLDDNPFAESAAPEAVAEEPGELPSFNLDGATFTGAEETPAEEAPRPPAMESLGEESLAELNLDEFSLPESAEEFGLGEPAAPPPPPRAPAPREKRRPARPAPAPVPMAAEEEPADDGDLQLTPEQFAQLKRSLDELPRNLKIAVQDLIGQGTATGANLRQLVDMLLRGGSAQEVATLAGKITGKRIRVPAGYEKRSGAALEAEQRTFRYAFRENILPILRVVLITIVAGGLFGFLGYWYGYRPIAATTNYRVGYGQIANDRYLLANERFARASAIWAMKGWYYRYAEAFAAKRQFVLAEEKYDQLLARPEFRGDKKAILDYARMESLSLSDYQKADTLLNRILDTSMYDYDALLAAGDNDLEWAAALAGKPSEVKYEAARLAYATLIERNGAQNALLFRMLKFFIRTDNGTEVERLRAYYATRPDIRVDAPVYAELGGYLVDHRRLDYVQDVLFRADKEQPGLYEVHYNLARYYRIVASPENEKLALDATVKLLSPTDPLTAKRLRIEIDTHTRLGEFYYKTREYIAAEKDLGVALRLIEQNQKNRLIGKERMFGRAYVDMGDMFYYIQGDLEVAARHYQSALDNLYTDPELTYKIGYIQYAQGNYKASLTSFTDAEQESVYPSGNEAEAPAAAMVAAGAVTALPGQVPQNLLFALGNSFYQRGDYFAAQGFYLRLLDRLTTQRALRGTLHPEDTPEDRAFLDVIAKVNNNIGVAMIRLGDRTGDRKKKSAAMVYLTTAAQIADSLNRNPDTVQRSEIRSISTQNLRNALYPVTGKELNLFADLPKDLAAASW